jgi:hypothetical protein
MARAFKHVIHCHYKDAELHKQRMHEAPRVDAGFATNFAFNQQWRGQDFEVGRATWRARSASLYGGFGGGAP